MFVRRMTLDDSRCVAELTAQLGYPSSASEITARLGKIAGEDDHGLFVAQTPGGDVAGWVHVHGACLLQSDPCAEIGGLVVDESLRGQGVGRALMAEAERWALEHGYEEVRLRSNIVRHEAHEFYRHLGYEPVKQSYTFRKQLRIPGGNDTSAERNA
jgi:GNAT superfamily N-acetyltransferase